MRVGNGAAVAAVRSLTAIRFAPSSSIPRSTTTRTPTPGRLPRCGRGLRGTRIRVELVDQGDAGDLITAYARDLRVVTKLVITAPKIEMSRATNRAISERYGCDHISTSFQRSSSQLVAMSFSSALGLIHVAALS
jgi:hypothetical protein